MATEFMGFPKIARYSREVIVTEKIDGTNACIYIVIYHVASGVSFKKTIAGDDAPKGAKA